MPRLASLLLALLLIPACSKQSQESSEPESATAAAAGESGGETKEDAPDQADQKAKGHNLSWQDDLEKAQALARKQGRDLFIDVSASWCAPCQELEEVTFADEAVAKRLSDQYVALKLDVTEQTDADKALMDKFGVKLLPALLVVRDEEILLTIRTFIGPRELETKLDEMPPR